MKNMYSVAFLSIASAAMFLCGCSPEKKETPPKSELSSKAEEMYKNVTSPVVNEIVAQTEMKKPVVPGAEKPVVAPEVKCEVKTEGAMPEEAVPPVKRNTSSLNKSQGSLFASSSSCKEECPVAEPCPCEQKKPEPCCPNVAEPCKKEEPCPVAEPCKKEEPCKVKEEPCPCPEEPEEECESSCK